MKKWIDELKQIFEANFVEYLMTVSIGYLLIMFIDRYVRHEIITNRFAFLELLRMMATAPIAIWIVRSVGKWMAKK